MFNDRVTRHMFRQYSGLIGLALATLLAGCAGLPGSVAELSGSVKYRPVVTEQKSIPQVAVTVIHRADGVYQVQVENDLPDAVSLQWSNSAYVNTSGDTVRLIQMKNVDAFPDDPTREQLASPIARGARLKTYFVGESWIDYARRGVMPRPRDVESKAKIYLAFNIKDKRVYWTGDVTFIPDKEGVPVK